MSSLSLKLFALTIAVLIQAIFLSQPKLAKAEDPFITLASTTSTKNSGLYDYLLPKFTQQSGINVRVVAVGTGQAIRLAKSGDADILLVHHKKSELAFVAEGYGIERFDVMYNDFVIIGPTQDAASIRAAKNVISALKQIAQSKQPFASRGDDSGTNKKELSLWQEAGINVEAHSGSWYRETGSGMGATLNTASAMNAYTLSDRATWLKFSNKGSLEILVEGDTKLFNQYGVILVSEKRHPHIKSELGQKFIDWIISRPAQQLINEYRIEGQKAFFSNASP